MEQRRLGAQGLTVPAMGLGIMGMSGVAGSPNMYGTADDAESIATIHRSLALGVNFFDTAEVYGLGRNEALLARALAGRPRHESIIATKFGFRFSAEGRIAGVDGSPANARRALDASLRHLQTDYVDLWYQHRLDRSVPIEDTVGAMAEQVRAGKVRYLGLSEVSAQTLRRAHAVHPISALQSEYSIWERNIEGDVLDTCRALGIGIVPYCPLGRGFLTGTVAESSALPESDYRRHDPRFTNDHHAANQRIVAVLREVGERHGATAAQVALAWLLSRGPDVVPIPGTKRRRWLEENAAAAQLRLSADDLRQLDGIGAAVAGARYTPKSMATIDR
jgi:aryl-alcohol dehydrogenase-like predicted oxidoreductase